MQPDPRDVVDDEEGIKTREVPTVAERAKALGLTVPNDGVVALPRRFFIAKDVAELTYEPNTTNVKVLLRQAGVTLNTVQSDGTKIPFREDRDDTWVSPALYVAAGMILRNPALVKQMVEAISGHVMEMFRGIVGRVRLTVAVEKTEEKKTVLVTFNGPADKLGEMAKHIEKLAK